MSLPTHLGPSKSRRHAGGKQMSEILLCPMSPVASSTLLVSVRRECIMALLSEMSRSKSMRAVSCVPG
eukprot:8386034-Alexandrium_andersonii.AAC.1